MLSSKTRFRLAAAVIATSATTIALAGCSTSTSEGGSDTLTVGTNGGDAMKAVIADFEASHAGITVEVRDTPQNYQQLMSTQLTGGTAPDVLQIWPGTGNNVSVKVAGAKGFYADVSDAAWAKEVPESARQLLSTDDGKLVAVPMTFSSIGGIYNATAMEELGLSVPTTWSEVIQLCSDAKEAGKIAYGLGLSDTWTTQLIPYALTATLVYANDDEFVQKQLDGTASFSDSAWRTAFEKYMEMDDADCFNDSPNGTPYSEIESGVREGDILSTVSVAAETKTIETGGADNLTLNYQSFPATDDADETFLSATIGPSFAINAKSENADLASEFLAFLAEPETQIKYADTYGDTAALPGDLTQQGQVPEMVSEYVASGKISSWPDQLWPSATIQPAMFDGVQALFSGQNDVDGVLKTMDDEFVK